MHELKPFASQYPRYPKASTEDLVQQHLPCIYDLFAKLRILFLTGEAFWSEIIMGQVGSRGLVLFIVQTVSDPADRNLRPKTPRPKPFLAWPAS